MKLVTWKGYRKQYCGRCGSRIQRLEKAWRVGGGRYSRSGKRRYFCEKCGDEIQQ